MGLWTFLFLALLAGAVQCRIGTKITGPGRQEADLGEFPFLAIIMDKATRTLITSGVLIKPKVVLTLGFNYYLNSVQPEDIAVVVGMHNISETETTTQTIDVNQILIHPELIQTWEGKYTGDMSLIQLKTDVTITSRVKFLPVRNINGDPKVDNRLPQYDCICAGYGRIVDNYDEFVMPDTLQKYEPEMKGVKACKSYARDKDLPWPKRRWLCSLNEDRTENRPGDGGNPLLCRKGVDEDFTLCGIVSSGTPGYEREGFTAYTRLSTFKRWIMKNSNILQND